MNFKKMMSEVLFILFYCLVSSYFSFTYAAGIIELNQPKIRLSILPGSSKSGVIEVKNPNPEPKVVKVYLEDWFYTTGGDGSKIFKPTGTSELSASDWISFVPSEFNIPAYGVQYVNYMVRVPFNVTGGHYSILFFEVGLSKPGEIGNGEAGISLAVRLATLFYIEPEGTIRRNVQLENLSLVRKSKDKPLEIDVDFKNTGNVDITAGGSFHIMDNEGVIYARGEFNDVYTFPGDTAKLTTTWKEPIPKGKYDLVLTVDIGKAQEEAGLGRGPVIVKEAEVEFGNNGEVVRVGELK